MKREHHIRKIRNKTSSKLDYILLGLIMVVAAVLRLWKLDQVPFMHDEFSALIRTNFDNLHDLVSKGIIADTHPTGVQLFLFLWAKIFGWNELYIKLPFALMGIASIYLVFKVGKQWFNNKVGLFAAAFFAVSQFTVFYSQLARPYMPGVCFVLLFAVFWNKMLFDIRKPSLGTCIGFAVTAALAALAHSFSTAQAGLMFLTGLFFLIPKRRKAYWLSSVGALALYSPNLPIFYQQLLKEAGFGSWLAKPKPTFLIDFLQYTMNYSPLFIFSIGIIIILPIILQRRQKRPYPIRWAAAAWFLIAFGMAYVYSLLREPILQRSTLIFSYPFIVIIAFSLFKNNTLTKIQTVAVVLIILFTGTITLITTRSHYELMYHQGFDQIAIKVHDDNKQYGEKIHFATRSEIGTASEFYQAQTDVKDRIIFDRYKDLHDFTKWMHDNPKEMLGFGWTDYAYPIWETYAVANYPYCLFTKDWFTSRYLTLSKTGNEGGTYLLNELPFSPSVCAKGQEWSQAVTFTLDSTFINVEALSVIANIHCDSAINNCTMVIEIHDAETKDLIFWHGSQAEEGQFLSGDNIFADALLLDDKWVKEKATVKARIWNIGRSPFTINKMSYYTRKKDPILTGLYDPLN